MDLTEVLSNTLNQPRRPSQLPRNWIKSTNYQRIIDAIKEIRFLARYDFEEAKAYRCWEESSSWETLHWSHYQCLLWRVSKKSLIQLTFVYGHPVADLHWLRKSEDERFTDRFIFIKIQGAVLLELTPIDQLFESQSNLKHQWSWLIEALRYATNRWNGMVSTVSCHR